MTDALYYAALSSNELISPKRFSEIIEQCGSVKAFFEMTSVEQMKMLQIRSVTHASFFERMPDEGERILSKCEKLGIRVLTQEDEAFPAKLKTIPEAPYILYVLGELNYTLPLVGVVGTREATPDAIELNNYFISELVNYGIGIISGLAMGHDSVAQRTVLEHQGYTAAIVASGLDIVYPAENRDLFAQIVETGAVVSEYPPGTRPDKWRFPMRNRIISGLSDAVLLIQAPEKSGALITADYAILQHRSLYVLPGNPINPQNAGSNRMIREGGKLALTPEEIVFELIGNGAQKASNVQRVNYAELEPDERLIWDALDSEKHIDELIQETDIDAGKLNSILTMMELKGLVLQYPGRFYVRNR